MNYTPKILIAVSLCLSAFVFSSAQINDSPAGAYQWKKGKTEFQNGYVVLKSGKKMDGKISLKGSATQIAEVAYEGDGKELTFPVGSLKSYGLVGVNPNATTEVSTGPINESPESMYEWQSRGIVMGKEILATTPRAGYVVLKNGTRYEGELKLRKKAGVLEDIDIKTATGKEKFDVPQVARYGYTVSEAEVAQKNLAKESKKSFQGSILSSSGKQSGDITIVPSGKRYAERIIFKGSDGKLTDHTPETIIGFNYINGKGKQITYTVIDKKFLPEQFQGKTFQVFLNPNPTSINEFATSLAKAAVNVGTTAAATAAVKKDQEKNDYVSNMDSVIRVSSAEQLITLRDQIASLAGYESAQDAINNSDNESLKTNLSALELAIQGKQTASAPGGILNEEWIILNKVNNEKTIVYKSKYKDQIDVLLMGCDKYLELSKSQQNDLQKWNNLVQTMKLLDGCY
jgi:hypothetical protein